MTFIFELWRFSINLGLFTYRYETRRYMYLHFQLRIWNWMPHISVFREQERLCIEMRVDFPYGYFAICEYHRQRSVNFVWFVERFRLPVLRIKNWETTFGIGKKWQA